MKKRFVVLVEDSTKEQNDAFLEAMKAKALNWWHWVPNGWLFIDNSGKVTAAEIRDVALLHYPNANQLVLELQSDGTDTWAGFGPNTEKKNMFKWLESNWKDD